MRTFLFLCCLALPAHADMQTARDAFTNGQFAKAVENLKPAANAGNAEAEFLLGNIYMIGMGTAKNQTRGFEFYLRAALKGHPAAQLRLVNAYTLGQGTQMDPIRAYVWAELATIGRATGIGDQAQRLRDALSQSDRELADELIQDYRTYLFPLEKD